LRCAMKTMPVLSAIATAALLATAAPAIVQAA
jgi:hypothetical protein